MNVSEKIKQGKILFLRMQEAGMKQADLANLLGVDQAHISRHFAKKGRLGIEKARQAARHFSIPLEDVY